MKYRRKFTQVLALVSIFSISCSPINAQGNLLKEAKKVDSIFSIGNDSNLISLLNSAQKFSSKLVSRGINYFKSNDNYIISPISAYLLLTMASEMTKGNTQDELLKATNTNLEILRNSYSSLVRLLERSFKGGEFNIDNSIWLNSDREYNQDCLDILANNYYCSSYEVDFSNNNQYANQAITNHIDENTNGLLKPNFNLAQDTLFALANIIYLKDIWDDYIDELSFHDEKIEFTNSNNSKVDKDFLNGLYVVGKTYKGEDFTTFYSSTYNGYKLHFVLPKAGYSIEEVFIEDNINQIMNITSYGGIDDVNKIRTFTRCVFPEFEVSGSHDLVDFMVNEFNINDLFNQNCDLTGLINNGASVESLQQVVKLNVNKKGIEGAAVTVMAGDESTSDPYSDYQSIYEEYIVDKSFGFILTDENNINLFSGIIYNI